MVKRMLGCFVFVFAVLSLNAFAQQTSPVGLWTTIDDKTGKPKALIRIEKENGKYKGRIEKLFADASPHSNPTCKSCEDERKDQPILGMTILSGFIQENFGEYTGGHILDPASGEVYKSKMTVIDGGKKLNVRGYIGMPAFGRSQTWLRVE